MRDPAHTYAEALVDAALDQGNPEQVKRDLAAFLNLMAESADLRNFLANPSVVSAAKHAVIEKLAARLGTGKSLSNFLFVVVDHCRSPLLGEIQQAFVAQLNARLGIAEARVTSALELSEAEKKELSRVLERLTGKRVEARYRLDPELIGGAVVQIGSTIYDGSVRDQLNRLRARLASA